MGWSWASNCVICGRERSGLMSAWGYLPMAKERGLRPLCGPCRQDLGDKGDPADVRSDLVKGMELLCRPLLGRIEESIAVIRNYRDEHERIAEGECPCGLCNAARRMIGRKNNENDSACEPAPD